MCYIILTMGRKGRSQTKTISKTLGDQSEQDDLQQYFNQMIGSEKADPKIVLPKYKSLMERLDKIHSLLLSCKSDVLDTLDNYQDASLQITEFTNQIKILLDKKVDDEKFESEQYALLKDHDIFKTMIVVCSNLSDIHVHLKKSWKDVDKKFFMRYTSLKFTPLPFAKDLDFKKMWIVDSIADESITEYVFTFLSTIFKNVYAIYKTMTSPDINVAHLSSIIVKALGGLKQHLPRCAKAFKKIEESVSLLEGNFDTYYKDFVQSKDPTNIFTGFIGDVADTCESDPQLIFQCRKIINFYKKNAQKRTADGGASNEKTKMFDALMKNYTILEKKALSTIDKTECDDNTDEENADEENADTSEPATLEKEIDAELPDIDLVMKHINSHCKKSVSK
jgi:hypothetical protein